jgi:myo-inositol-1(or 4)-monophosphatase
MRPPSITVVSNTMIKAGKNLLRDFGEVVHLQNALDGTKNFVNTTVRRTESAVHESMHKLYPQHNLWFSHGGRAIYNNASQAATWIFDLLNGQENFSHGLPHFAMSAALMEQGQLVAGIIYDPLHHDLFWSYRGLGAYLNQVRLRVSGRKHMLSTVVAVPPDNLKNQGWKHIEPWQYQVASLRTLGAPALDLAYVATGRLDGFWSTEVSFPAIAAGMALVREAGGMMSRPGVYPVTSQEVGPLVVGNEHVHQFLHSHMRTLIKEPTRA